jgi:hypothetical protein
VPAPLVASYRPPPAASPEPVASDSLYLAAPVVVVAAAVAGHAVVAVEVGTLAGLAREVYLAVRSCEAVAAGSLVDKYLVQGRRRVEIVLWVVLRLVIVSTCMVCRDGRRTSFNNGL